MANNQPFMARGSSLTIQCSTRTGGQEELIQVDRHITWGVPPPSWSSQASIIIIFIISSSWITIYQILAYYPLDLAINQPLIDHRTSVVSLSTSFSTTSISTFQLVQLGFRSRTPCFSTSQPIIMIFFELVSIILLHLPLYTIIKHHQLVFPPSTITIVTITIAINIYQHVLASINYYWYHY